MLGKPHCQICRNFLTTGNCAHGDRCAFIHAVQMHKSIENSDVDTSNSVQNNRGYGQAQKTFHPTSDVALWNDASNNTLKIFTASHDGNWRLYDTANGFNEEFRENMGGKINAVMVASNFLFAGYQGTAEKVPGVQAGMIRAWNLRNPTGPKIEFCMHDTAPYAHASSVSCFITKDDMCISGGTDSAIRIWKYDADANGRSGGFKIVKTLLGHAGEITGLVIVGTMLWSCSTDMTIRLWDSASDWECKYLISQSTQGNALAPQTSKNGQSNGVGHTDAVTGLVYFESQAGKFVLSSSLDGNVKVWNSTNGDCLSTTPHGEGITSMALSTDTKGNAILLCGTMYGKIIIRVLLQTAKTTPMCFLCSIDVNAQNCGHVGPVKRIVAGPSNTFYTAGNDGKLAVWQITGDFDL